MSRVTKVTVTDDLDGSVGAESVRFALDGQLYEIDLSAEHASELRAVLAAYVAAGRRTTARAAQSPARPRRTVDRDYDPSAVRAWARARRINVPARGRVPGSVLARFRAAGN